MSTKTGDVTVTVTDITGRLVAIETFPETSLQKTSPQQPAIYQMRVSLSLAGTYFLTAQQNGHTASAPCAVCGINEKGLISLQLYLKLEDLRQMVKIGVVGVGVAVIGATMFNVNKCGTIEIRITRLCHIAPCFDIFYPDTVFCT